MKEESKLPYGGAMFSFTSFEEAMEHMAEQEAAANESVSPAQRAITWGDYVIRLVPDLVIWGAIPEWDDLVAMERGYYADPFKEDEQAEFEYTIAGLRDRLERGYVFGSFTSADFPQPELGDAHISTLWKISKEDYEIARRNDWHLWPELALRLKAEFAEEQTHGRDKEGTE
jgi:hypothetical protein